MSMRMSKNEQELLVLDSILEVITDLNENDNENFLYSVNSLIEDRVFDFFDYDQVDEAEELTLRLQRLAEPLLYKAVASQVKLVKTKKSKKRRK